MKIVRPRESTRLAKGKALPLETVLKALIERVREQINPNGKLRDES